MAKQQTPTEQQAEKPKTPRELAFDNMCDVLVKATGKASRKARSRRNEAVVDT